MVCGRATCPRLPRWGAARSCRGASRARSTPPHRDSGGWDRTRDTPRHRCLPLTSFGGAQGRIVCGQWNVSRVAETTLLTPATERAGDHRSCPWARWALRHRPDGPPGRRTSLSSWRSSLPLATSYLTGRLLVAEGANSIQEEHMLSDRSVSALGRGGCGCSPPVMHVPADPLVIDGLERRQGGVVERAGIGQLSVGAGLRRC